MRCPNAGVDVLLKGCPHLSLGVGMVTRKGLLTAPKGVTAAGYHPNLIIHIFIDRGGKTADNIYIIRCYSADRSKLGAVRAP